MEQRNEKGLCIDFIPTSMGCNRIQSIIVKRSSVRKHDSCFFRFLPLKPYTLVGGYISYACVPCRKSFMRIYVLHSLH